MLISKNRDLSASFTALLIIFNLIKYSIQQSWKNDKIIKQWQQLPSNLFGESMTANSYGNNAPSLPLPISSNNYPAPNSPSANGYPVNNYQLTHQSASPSNGYPANSYPATQSNTLPSKSYPAPSNGYPSPSNGYPANSYPATQSNTLPSKSYPAPSNGYPSNNYPVAQSASNGYPANNYPASNSNPSISNAYPASNYPGANSNPSSANSYPANNYQANNYPTAQSNPSPSNGYPANSYQPVYQNPPSQSSYSNIPNAIPINLNEYSNNQNFVSSSVSMGSNGGVYTVQQPVISNSGENIIETLISGITYDCRGKPSGHWRDPRYCDIFHACVFGNQRKTYSCPVVGERTYFDETSRRCEFANTNPQGCPTNSYFHHE